MKHTKLVSQQRHIPCRAFSIRQWTPLEICLLQFKLAVGKISGSDIESEL